jgi:hypothetical protein
MIQFIPLAAQDAQERFAAFSYEGGLFFEIVQEGRPLGLIGITDVGHGFCNLGLYVPPEDRHKIGKEFVLHVIDFPFQVGFKVCLYMTLKESLIKLLKSLHPYGIRGCGTSEGYACFYKEYAEV